MVEQVVGLRFVVEGEREAAQALERVSDNQSKLTRDIMKGADKVNSLSREWDKLNRYLKDGTINTEAHARAQLAVAREYAILNGLVKTNGDLNTRRAQKILRADQAQKESIEDTRRRAETAFALAMQRHNEEQRAQKESIENTRRRAETAFALAMQRHNEEQRALQQEQAERLRLEAMYDRNAVAARVYQNAVANLNRAEQLGVITADQKAKELMQLEAAYQRAGTSANRTNTFINQFGEGARIAGIKTNRFGLYAQQVGYQVGDFFVQIQSGTNAFVAFGQQATQLAGLLPGLAGAIVGISISVATMFLSAWSRAKQEAEDVSESLDNLVSSLDASTSATERAMTPIKELREEYGRFAEAIQTAARLRAQAELSNAMRELEGATQQIGNELDAFRIAINDAGKALNDYNDIVSYVGEENINNASTVNEAWKNYEKMAEAASGAAEGLGLTSYQAGRLDNALQDLARARGIEDIADAAANALNEIDAMFTSTQTIPPEVAKIIAALEKVATSAAAGAGSAIVETKDVTTKLANEMSRAAREALNFVNNLGGGAGVSAAIARVAGLRAELEARRGGASEVDVAMERARAQAMADPRTQAALQGPVGLAEETRRRIAEEVEAARLGAVAGQIQQEISDLLRPETGGADGTAGGADDFLSRFPELQAAFEQAQADLQSYNQEVEILDSALAKGLITQQEYNSYVDQAAEAYGQTSLAAKQYENAMLQMANTTSQAMSDAFMSIVDGTKSAKDAFSDMVRIIIKKAFEMAVINPILNAIFGAAGLGVSGYVAAPSFFGAPAAAAAKGMTFQGGNVVPFANGGVVGGPATFPMSGGRTGLMGEAGPEAIMPLKRGKDGKLGVQATGGGVVINQSFNISANGDESVKRIVQQQIPNIAQATKAAVVDAKRRGGSYGRAFA